MRDYVEMMKEIMKDAGWSQEELAGKLGVSFASVNAWLNGKSRPREKTVKRIEALYLARGVTPAEKPVFVTIVGVPKYVKVGDTVMLERWESNEYDDEAIGVSVADEDPDEDFDFGFERGDWHEDWEGLYDATGREEDEYMGVSYPYHWGPMYVANSVKTVARGTYSAGRIYDKLKGIGLANVEFIVRGSAIARVIDWGGDE